MKRDVTAYSAPRPAWDRNDCSIRAFSVAAGCSYEFASAAFSVAGRKIKRGTCGIESQRVMEEYFHMEPVTIFPGMCVAEFACLFPEGSFVCHRRRHAFAIIDGVLHDWQTGTVARSIVVAAWRVTEKTRDKVRKLQEVLGL